MSADIVTLLCTHDCLNAMRAIFDEFEKSFNIAIRHVDAGANKNSAETLAEIDVGICLFGEDPAPLFRNVLSKHASSLKAIHVGWVGTNGPSFDALRERGVQIYNSPGVNAAGLSWNLVAGLLIVERRMLHFIDAQRRREWEKLPETGDNSRRDVAGLTAVVLGFGEIGRSVSVVLRSMGMRIVAVRRSPLREGEPADEWAPPGDLERVAAKADWIINCAPLTEETRGIVSRAVIRALPRGAGFANVGRGATVDEAALVDALKDGHLRGAYIDVFVDEPLPAHSPFWDMPNVLLTPHNAGGAEGNQRRSVQILQKTLTSWLTSHLGRGPFGPSPPARL